MSLEQDKYYTPTIEEFHVGFEYEIIDLSSNNYQEDESKCKWDKKIIEESNFYSSYKENSLFESVLSYLDKNRIRVKYLDKQDIESLGFKFLTKVKEKASAYQLDNWSLYNDENCELKIVKLNTNSILGYDVYFNGYCKSINELRKILEFLNIK